MNQERALEQELGKGLARAFGGAVLFALPLLMTMEMWWLGFYMEPGRLLLLMGVMFPMLVGLSYYCGFRETFSWKDDLADGLVAYGVAFAASALVLLLLNVIGPGLSVREVVGKVALQAVPGGFGAVLASHTLGGRREEEAEEKRKRKAGYGGELFLMAAGALFLAFNLAPTEEMVLIAFMMTEVHALALLAVSLVFIHAFVYALDFKGASVVPEGMPGWSVFLRSTVAGYAVSLLVSAYVLWTFGRFEDGTLPSYVMMTVVLGFPASLGAAAARLII